jgi:hypothetical protein
MENSVEASQKNTGSWWLTLVILATQEAEIRRILAFETLS